MRGTLLYIGQRLVLIAITTVLVSSIVFLLLHQIPGNAFLNETRQSEETLRAELHHYGLDLPLPQQSRPCSSERPRSAPPWASSHCSSRSVSA